MPFPPQGTLPPPPLLSLLEIDTDKDWQARRILNIGVPTTTGDALRKGTRQTMAEMPSGEARQVLMAQGIGLDPVYAGVRVEVRTTDPPIIDEGQIWFRSDANEWMVTERLPFGQVIRSDTARQGACGIGGDVNTIWNGSGHFDNIAELSTVDFSVIRMGPAVFCCPWHIMGAGGKIDVIWVADDTARIFEAATSDLSVIRYGSISDAGSGAGGTTSKIWLSCVGVVDRIYELSPTDFSTIRFVSSPTTWPTGIGGDEHRIWHCEEINDHIHELAISDFAVVRTIVSPATQPRGIGGNIDRIWHCQNSPPMVYEISTELGITRLVTSPEVDGKMAIHDGLASPHTAATAIGGRTLGLADGNLAILPTATSGLVLTRGATAWEALAVPDEIEIFVQTTEPGIAANKVAVWHDNTAGAERWWLIFGTDGTTAGNRKTELL